MVNERNTKTPYFSGARFRALRHETVAGFRGSRERALGIHAKRGLADRAIGRDGAGVPPIRFMHQKPVHGKHWWLDRIPTRLLRSASLPRTAICCEVVCRVNRHARFVYPPAARNRQPPDEFD